ncbi:hypothetical protein [Limnohabitans sp. Rim8]|uniref:AbrB/MazE/SpoVT family DNA-binding domain-containing protein n=1 Tax=Limnohabitans sp. Rim8 TaxID=1100718 RepID=UPI0026355FFD|nr:hypothetical protein [Limnohabitans sp. Rim8]
MEAVICKWGNSPALRLPSAALKEAGFAIEQKVKLVVLSGRIVTDSVIRPSLDWIISVVAVARI